MWENSLSFASAVTHAEPRQGTLHPPNPVGMLHINHGSDRQRVQVNLMHLESHPSCKLLQKYILITDIGQEFVMISYEHPLFTLLLKTRFESEDFPDIFIAQLSSS